MGARELDEIEPRVLNFPRLGMEYSDALNVHVSERVIRCTRCSPPPPEGMFFHFV